MKSNYIRYKISNLIPDSLITIQLDEFDLGGSIENVRINTLPYTNTGKGYTRIVIKTNNVPSMTGNNSIYIASKEQDKITTRKEVEEKYYIL